ncbi:MAG: T9SS type A sorting domain-containing protein [Lentimicrobium sp.]|nr:T9SS type A sorting domain-containing protein [Lentimicrobium sp.]
MKKLTIFILMILAANLTLAQWIKQNPVPGNSDIRFNNIFFHDQNLGWVVGGTINGNSCYLTTDGGNSWDWMLVWNEGMATGVHFTDENNGWICGGGYGVNSIKMCHTSNGGVGLEGWLPQYAGNNGPGDLKSVFFIDSLTGWTVLNFNSGMGSWYKFYKTNDGGNDWTYLYGNDGGWYNDIHFINDSTGFSVGIGFLRSYDGGTTWDWIEIDMWGNALEVIDENTIWIAGENDYQTNVGIIKSSNDGGTTWTKIIGDTIPAMNDIKFIGPNLGWAVGNEGTILHTTDGGEIWEYQESGTTADLFSVSFVDENHGWICGDSSIILHTNNGGLVGLNEMPEKLVSLSVSPNPFSQYAVIGFYLPYTAHASIQIFNAMGAKVAELHYGQLPAGQQQFTWHAGDLPKGLYFCRVRMGNESTTQKLIKY